MRPVAALTFRGALQILGHHERPVLTKINDLLGGVILASGAIPAAAIWGWVDQKNEATGLLGRLLNRFAERRLQLAGYERTELIAAAHTVLAISSLMEAFRETLGAHAFKSLELTDKELQSILLDDPDADQRFVDSLYQAEVPIPSGGRGFQENIALVRAWQEPVLLELIDFCSGLAAWSDTAVTAIRVRAIDRYTSHYYELAAKVPEFMMWALIAENDAARADIRGVHTDVRDVLDGHSNALSRLESLLRLLGEQQRPGRDLVLTVRRAAVAELDAPIVPSGSAELIHDREIRFPAVRDIYIEPNYRLVRFKDDTYVSNEHWWQDLPSFDNLDLRLAAHLSSPESTRLPLLVLGHPGAGKSIFTKVLAARLPESSFTTVRVPLRHVDADAPVFRQIQQALDRATHERVSWNALTDQSANTVRVVLLDGLDELVQASSKNRASFLHEVAEFQRVEANQNRPVAVIVTTRTVVADRVEIPDGCTVVKLEGFSPEQIEQWRATWNRTNKPGIDTGRVRELSKDVVASSGELVEQPLLLLMIALYAADPSTPEIERGFSQTTLYQRLLENFAQRESTKPNSDPVKDHLRRLSIAALAMFNRGREYVTDAELTADFAALGAGPPRDLGAQFFFVYTSQSIEGTESPHRSYEFLHATLKEYLVARELVEVLRDTADSAQSRRGVREPDDDLLFALLSHQCLATSYPALMFVMDILRGLDNVEQTTIAHVLNRLVAGLRRRHGSDRYTRYRPSEEDRVRELASYSANLVLLRVLASHEPVSLHDLWQQPYTTEFWWESTVSLWRSGLAENGWRAMLDILDLDNNGLQLWPGTRTEIAEVLQADLLGNPDLALTLKMGLDLRRDLSPRLAYGNFDRDEELTRWLIQAAVHEVPFMGGEQIEPFVQGIGRSKFHSRTVSLLLKLRSGQLNNTAVRALVESVLHPVADEVAVLSAIIAHPHLLKVLPNVVDEFTQVGDAVQVLIMAHDHDETASDLRIFFAKLREKAAKLLTPERVPEAIAALVAQYRY